MNDVSALPAAHLSRLRAGHRDQPIGLPAGPIALSWSPGPEAADPDYRVSVSDENGQQIWSTSTTRPRTVLPSDGLLSRGKYRWSVSTGQEEVESSFELGLRPDDWSAQWIQPPRFPFAREAHDPAPYLRRPFEVDEVGGLDGRLRLHITALGLYRVWLNGVELTCDALLRPGWTDYTVRVHHQTFDCDGLLVDGTNVLAVTLAKGWYAGRVGLQRRPGLYGDRTALLAQLDLVGADGAARTVCSTDDEWTTSFGSILATDILRGETVDLRQEPTGWRVRGFDDAHWASVEQYDGPAVHVVPQPHDSIRVLKEHPGKLVREHARGPVVFDFGQNIVGWTRVESQVLPDTEVIVRHGEILTPENLVYRDNLRGAFQEDRYADAVGGVRTLETSFTAHGFRYAEVWGLPSDDPFGATVLPQDSSITAMSIETAHDLVGRFAASDDRLTQLASAIEWTVRDNFLEVATDCPQRDERLGWLGDAGVITPTAGYFFDVAAFLGKFVQDAADSQSPDGEIRSYVPVTPPADTRPGAPGWADGYVRMVHYLVERYGDLATAEHHLEPMNRFAEHVMRHNPDGLRVNAVGADFADWLSLPEREGETVHPGYAYTRAFSTAPKPVVGTAHTYRTLCQLADVTSRLGHDAASRGWRDQADHVREAYRQAFLRADGTIADATQTVYAQAIGYGLLDEAESRTAAGILRELIEKRGYVTTGIHGVEHVLPALARHGQRAFAIELLLRDEMPSWLYMLSKGGTTIWEKWDGIGPDGTLSTAEMNSFNHCALGAVGAFLFEDLMGIRVSSSVWDGSIGIEPTYSSRLDWVGGTYDSPVGLIGSRWEERDGDIHHALVLPGGSRTTFVAPEGHVVVSVDGIAAETERPVLEPGTHHLVLRQEAGR